MEKSFWCFHSSLLKTSILENTIMRFSPQPNPQGLSGWWQSLTNGEKQNESILWNFSKPLGQNWVSTDIQINRSEPYLIRMLTDGRENPTYQVIFNYSFFDVYPSKEANWEKEKTFLCFSPHPLVSVVLPAPFLHLGTQNIDISFPSQRAHFQKRDVMNAVREWGCHGEAVPGKE